VPGRARYLQLDPASLRRLRRDRPRDPPVCCLVPAAYRDGCSGRRDLRRPGKGARRRSTRTLTTSTAHRPKVGGAQKTVQGVCINENEEALLEVGPGRPGLCGGPDSTG